MSSEQTYRAPGAEVAGCKPSPYHIAKILFIKIEVIIMIDREKGDDFFL